MALILIADDRPNNRELVRVVLESFGHDVIEAEDGYEALAKAKTKKPELILLDLHMPKLDGFATLGELKKDPDLRHIPVIALTASAMQGDSERALREGFSSYITKPISLRDFYVHISSFLKSP